MSLGPLTTTFTPAAGCDTIVYGKIYTSPSPTDSQTTAKYHSLGSTKPNDCYPPSFTPAANAFYSPGICPLNWYSACGAVEATGPSRETRAVCCPTSYLCVDTNNQDPWNSFACSRHVPTSLKLTVPQNTDGKLFYVETTLGPGVAVYADAVNVRWHEADYSITTITSGPITTSAQTASTAPHISNATLGAETQKKETLSSGSIAAITAVIVVFAISLIAFLLHIMRRRRRQQNEKLQSVQELDDGKAKSTCVDSRANSRIRELNGVNVSEIGGMSLHEMSAGHQRQELE